MGTGLPGGGGGGGGGSAAGGGGVGRSNSNSKKASIGLRFSATGVSTADLDLKKAYEEVAKTLQALPKEYVKVHFATSFLDNVYNQLFYLKNDLVTNQSWSRLENELQIPGGAGCMVAWVAKMVALSGEEDFGQKQKVVGNVQMALEDFCNASMNDDADLYLYGDSTSVINAIDRNPKFFDSIAGHFLSFLIWRIVEREKETLPPEVELKLHKACEHKANSIIAAFKQEFYHKKLEEIDSVTHQNLFYTFSKNLDWLIHQF